MVTVYVFNALFLENKLFICNKNTVSMNVVFKYVFRIEYFLIICQVRGRFYGT